MARKIPLEDWVQLEKAVREAATAISKAQSLATLRCFEAHRAERYHEAALWGKIENRLQDTLHALSPSLFYIQTEWTGGDSTNPRNFTLREPNIVGIPHAFPPEEVAAYRDETGAIRLPHRERTES